MSLPEFEEQGTISRLVTAILVPEPADPLAVGLTAARLVMNAGEHLGYFQSDLLAGPERTADRRRKLTLAEVARIRAAFQVAIEALDDLPPSAFKKAEGLTLVKGGEE